MNVTFKSIQWIILTSIVSIFLGILTFFTFINQSFIELNEINIQILLILDLVFVSLFFALIVSKSFKIIRERKKQKIGSETSLRYIYFFSFSTLLPSFMIAIFSLILFNVGLQRYFDSKITSAVNNSYDVAKNYIEETRNSIQSDILLMNLDINQNINIFYNNPNQFKQIMRTQRLIRKLDEVYLIDSSSNIILSDLLDKSAIFYPPSEQMFNEAIEGMPSKSNDLDLEFTSAIIKLNNFIDTYLYIIKYIDPQLKNYLSDTEQAVNFYYSIESSQSGIKITFALIYLIVVALLLFLSIFISLNFTSRLTKPIINLISASEQISLGNLNTKVPTIETDLEFVKLNKNFNEMIDRLKSQQDKLLLAERHTAWESVARKLAHEIKNPLTPIQLSIDRLKEKYSHQINEKNDEFSNYLNTINKQIKDIEKLVNEFSDFARMPRPVFKKINLFSVISRAIQLNKFSNKNIKFNLSAEKKNIFIKCDEDQIYRVFINLIKNSIESINENSLKMQDIKGKIDVEISLNTSYIYVNLSDNGIGFNNIDIKRISTPYYTTKKDGTGLGLSIVTKIINDHDAEIIFSNSGKGAKVKIIFQKIKEKEYE